MERSSLDKQKNLTLGSKRIYNSPIFQRASVDVFGLWDIVALPFGDNPMYLIQVKTNVMPDASYLKDLINFKVPSYVRKELHIWKDGEKIPTILKLDTNDSTDSKDPT